MLHRWFSNCWGVEERGESERDGLVCCCQKERITLHCWTPHHYLPPGIPFDRLLSKLKRYQRQVLASISGHRHYFTTTYHITRLIWRYEGQVMASPITNTYQKRCHYILHPRWYYILQPRCHYFTKIVLIQYQNSFFWVALFFLLDVVIG